MVLELPKSEYGPSNDRCDNCYKSWLLEIEAKFRSKFPDLKIPDNEDFDLRKLDLNKMFNHPWLQAQNRPHSAITMEKKTLQQVQREKRYWFVFRKVEICDEVFWEKRVVCEECCKKLKADGWKRTGKKSVNLTGPFYGPTHDWQCRK